MKLTQKVILIIVSSVFTIIAIIFYLLVARFDTQIEKGLLSTARAIYKNIIIVRQWVSDYNGVYVFKKHGQPANPYLPHPNLITAHGDTLTLKNPALVTREMSSLSQLAGGQFFFHMASQNYLNPLHKPDDFENAALNFFKNTPKNTRPREFYRFEKINNHIYFRYFAPLFTTESCLSCHSAQGYKVGDLRGGISIVLSADDYMKAKRENFLFFLAAAFLTVIFLSFLIFIAIQRTVILPLHKIKEAASKIRKGEYHHKLQLNKNDEIGDLADVVEAMRMKIQDYTNQLKKSEEKYRSLIEKSPEAVAIIDENSHILECNIKLSRLTGFPINKLKSMRLNELLDKAKGRYIRSHYSPQQQTEHYEAYLFSQDGLKIPVEIYSIKGLTLGGRSALSFVYVRDLSERKKIEQYAIQTEKMMALGQVSSGIAHEIRNPLFALNNNIDFLKDHLNGNTVFQDIYPDLKDSIQRIQNIVSAILDYAKPHELEFKKVALKEIIEKSLLLVHKQFEKSNIQIQTELHDDNATIEADPHKMEQVFINLFLNSFSAMGKSGVLTIQTKKYASYILIKIQDTGIGIPPNELDRIFDPFYTKTPGGTGLGLAIVQRILDQHHARYRVESELYLGTTFYIYMPIKQE